MKAIVLVDVFYEGSESKEVVPEKFWTHMNICFEKQMEMPDDLKEDDLFRLCESPEVNLRVFSLSRYGPTNPTFKRKKRWVEDTWVPDWNAIVRFAIALVEWKYYIELCQILAGADFEALQLEEAEFWNW